ncbi:zinc finger protein 570-like [Achroia grisella]|uniref:zinc finger protein 570-like n=1 Tax=Achroia grisella TaxID=688607 RepID=UPI0027D29176|nr:zinc finger protein 570-like [Achroia grisella]
MDKCGICLKPAVQLFETGKEGVYACFKCQPLVPEVTIEDSSAEALDTSEPTASNSEEENNEALYCGICDKTFQKTMQLQNHLRNHRAERRFVCTYCNKAFSQSNNLRAHLRIHTNERPFKCVECGKAFTQVTNLNNHVRLHTGERPFVCPEPGCNKAYAQVTNLNQHRKRHLNGRPVEATYDCNICGEQFQQRNHMYTHRREAHGESKTSSNRSASTGRRGGRHICQVCEAVLPSERLLMQHVNQHANEDGSLRTKDERAEEGEEGEEGEAVEEAGEDGEGDGEGEGEMSCVFSSCKVRVSSARAHSAHLLRAHQLRVLPAPAAADRRHNNHEQDHLPPRRGRPPKVTKQQDPLLIKDSEYHEVKLLNARQVQFLPKLKVQSLFQ